MNTEKLIQYIREHREIYDLSHLKCSQGHFCDGTHRNAVPEALSQRDATRNFNPETFFPRIGITNPRLQPNFGPLYLSQLFI